MFFYFFFLFFFLFVFFLFLFLFFLSFFVFIGGFKGQVRWPEGPPHLALNPPYLLFVFFGSFPFFAFNRQKNLFYPLKKEFVCLFLVFLFLSPFAFFGLPLFQFLFLCLSVVLFFLPSFLSFFFAFFLFLVFVSCFPFLSSLLLFQEKNNIKIFNCNLFS